MEVELLEMPQEEAKKQVEALKEVFRRNKHIKQQEIYTDMRRVYGHIQKHGGKVIDVYHALKTTGLNEKGEPKIAICRADAIKCYCYRNNNGSATFTLKPDNRWRATTPRKTYGDIRVPVGTFEWHLINPEEGRISWNLKNNVISTIVPLIPAPILVDEVKHSLKNYYILWEVDEWKPEPPRDPILLKQLTPNLFGVLATWDLTDLERAIIRSNIFREAIP